MGAEYSKREAINRLQEAVTALQALVSGLTAPELAFLDSVTAGTGAASKALVLDASGNVIMPATGAIGLSRAVLPATGTNAATAAVIATQVVAVTDSNGTKAVALPAAAATVGPILVINTVATTGATLPVFPVSGGNDNINAGAEDAAFVVGPGQMAWFIPTSATQWYVAPVAAAAPTVAELDALVGAPYTLSTVATPGTGSCVAQFTIKDANGNAIDHVFSGMMYLTKDAAGASSFAAGTSVVVHTNGEITDIVTDKIFHFITTGAGLLGVTITSGADTYYMAFIMPDGRVVTSTALVIN